MSPRKSGKPAELWEYPAKCCPTRVRTIHLQPPDHGGVRALLRAGQSSGSIRTESSRSPNATDPSPHEPAAVFGESVDPTRRGVCQSAPDSHPYQVSAVASPDFMDDGRDVTLNGFGRQE
jgi:hypothetical protein